MLQVFGSAHRVFSVPRRCTHPTSVDYASLQYPHTLPCHSSLFAYNTETKRKKLMDNNHNTYMISADFSTSTRVPHDVDQIRQGNQYILISAQEHIPLTDTLASNIIGMLYPNFEMAHVKVHKAQFIEQHIHEKTKQEKNEEHTKRTPQGPTS